MDAKLTLRMDSELIAGAKTWARSRGISLSRAVEGFFEQLRPDVRAAPQIDALTRRLIGVVPRRSRLTDERIGKNRLEHIRRKHR